MATASPPPKIACPHCQALIKSPGFAAGSLVTCPKCGHGFRLGEEGDRGQGTGDRSQGSGVRAQGSVEQVQSPKPKVQGREGGVGGRESGIRSQGSGDVSN